MARRFDLMQYDPRDDSSPGAHALLDKDDYDAHAGVVINTGQPGDCRCGCGGTPQGKKAEFVQGHDARFKGILIRAHLADVPVTLADVDGNVKTRSAMEWAEDRRWGGWLRKSQARFEERKVRKPKSDDTLTKPRRVKVGRWHYDARPVGAEDGNVIFEYTTKKGEVKTVEIPASQVKDLPEAQ